MSRIHIPTLIVQGTVDTLFTLQEGVENYEILRKNGVPTAMIWFCGGHGVCLTPPGNQELPVTATIDWLNRYVKRDTSVNTGPGFQFVDQNGTSYSAGSFPVPTGAPLSADGQGTLPLVAGGGSGPADTSGSTQELASLVGTDHPGQGSQRGQRRHLLREPVGRGGGSTPAAAHLPGHVTAGHPADPGLRPVGGRIDGPGAGQPDHPDRRHPRRTHPHHLGPPGDGCLHRSRPTTTSSSSWSPPPWPMPCPGWAGASISPTSTSPFPVASDITPQVGAHRQPAPGRLPDHAAHWR